MASNTSKAAQPTDDVDAAFSAAGVNSDTGQDEFIDPTDLLNQVEEDDSEGWNPKEPSGISGWVTKVDSTRSDFAADGEDPNVPTITIQTKDGDKYRIIGFASVLKREITDKNPQVGDIFAVKYFGEQILKTGKFAGRPFKNYGVAVVRVGGRGHQVNPHDQ